MDGWMEGRMDAGWMDDGWMDGWMDDGWMDGGREGAMHGCIDGWIYICRKEMLIDASKQ